MNTLRSRLIAVLALASATLALFGLMDRYVVQRGQILKNGDFSAGFDNWQARGDGEGKLSLEDGVIRLYAEKSTDAPDVRQTARRRLGDNYMRLSAWVRHKDVSRGPHSWNALRIVLAQQNASGTSLWERPHGVFIAWGDGSWRRVKQVFWLASDITAVQVIVALYNVTGEAEVRDLSLDVVAESTTFNILRQVLSAFWLLALPWLAWPLLQWQRLAVLTIAFVILFGTLAPHLVKKDVQHFIQELRSPFLTSASVDLAAESASAPLPGKSTIPISEIWSALQKMGHLGLFALLALTVAMTWREQSWRRLALYLIVFAITAEILQLLSLDRSARPVDAGLNLLGTAAGLALGSYLLHRRARTTDQDPPSV
ncbi:MAG: VanZ family protein [Alphaproteobacteria bacterium]|nr:VanZ family protein [Alphaproteobacteria bacterium]MDP6830654.1 VanZ family protein [Alphaproteobacteria bacterium]